jgi:hypothetical protein
VAFALSADRRRAAGRIAAARGLPADVAGPLQKRANLREIKASNIHIR